MNISRFAILSLAILSQAFSQSLSLDQILKRTTEAIERANANNKTYLFEFTEKIIAGKINDEGVYEEVDTVISRVKIQGEEELDRTIIYSNSEEKESKKKKDKDSNLKFKQSFSPDDPDYIYSLAGETDSAFTVNIKPRKEKPDKGQISGMMVIDKNSFLIRTMDFEIPRPEKAKEISMLINFKLLENNHYVMTDMEIKGLIKALLGIISIRFKVIGEFYDYKLIEQVAPAGQ
jgi:hypothetical protein